MDKAQRCTIGFGLSYAVTCILSALLTVLKELNPRVQEAMKAATSDHWVTQGVFVIVAFFVLGIAFSRFGLSRKQDYDARRTLVIVVGATVLGGLILAVLYLVLAIRGV
jgi:uncharacterized membrane protein